MTATLIERARAFATIADYLPHERRTEIAKELADQIQARPTKRNRPRAAAAVHDANHLEGHTSIAEWLEGTYEGAALVRATAVLVRAFRSEWAIRYGSDNLPPQGFAPDDSLDLLKHVLETCVQRGRMP